MLKTAGASAQWRKPTRMVPETQRPDYPMHNTDLHSGSFEARRRRLVWPGLLALCILLVALLSGAGCARPTQNTAMSPAEREAALRQTAGEYARTGDLAQAQAALAALDVANPGQLLLSVAEADISAGRAPAEIEPLARLADALGVRSPKLVAYLAPTPTLTSIPPTSTTAPPTATLVPTATPELPTVTPQPSSPTPEPPTATLTPEPQQARVVADSNVNLRGGPGRAYPVIGQMRAGQELAIVARNASGDWWQLAWNAQGQAWVAGTVVSVLGPIDTVTVAQNIPTPPPQPTAAPRPTAAPVPAPVPSVDYRIIEQRMLTIQENGGCMGMHNIFVQVLDINGAAVNGAVVKRIWANETVVSGAKDCYWSIGVTGEGCASFDLHNAGDNVQILSDPVLGSVTSETTRKLSSLDSDISVDELLANGYCTEGRENCEWRKNPGDRPPQLCNGHYSWIVKFQRTR